MLILTPSEIKAISKITMVGARGLGQSYRKNDFTEMIYCESIGDGLWHTVNSQVIVKKENVLVKLSEHITW